MSEYRARADVSYPPGVVWAVLMDCETWQAWWGGDLTSVQPRWARGAEMRWGLGGPSVIREMQPTHQIAFATESGTVSRLVLEPAGGAGCRIEYTQDFSHSRMRVTDPRAVQSRADEIVAGLKRFVEAEGVRYPVAVPQKAKGSRLDRLVEDLGAQPREMRLEAARELGRSGDAAAVEPLVVALKDEDESVREAAAEALDELGWVPPTHELKAVYFVARRRWYDCAEMGSVGVHVLIRVHQLHQGRSSGDAVDLAMRALVQTGESVVEPLTEALGDDDKWTAVHAANTLGEIGDNRAVDALWLASQDPFPNLRRAALVALAKVKDPRALDGLLASIDNDNDRVAAIQGLGALGDPRGVDALARAARDPQSHVRSWVAQALGQIGTPAAAQALLPMRGDHDEFVRRRVEESLSALEEQTGVPIQRPATAAPWPPTKASSVGGLVEKVRTSLRRH